MVTCERLNNSLFHSISFKLGQVFIASQMITTSTSNHYDSKISESVMILNRQAAEFTEATV